MLTPHPIFGNLLALLTPLASFIGCMYLQSVYTLIPFLNLMADYPAGLAVSVLSFWLGVQLQDIPRMRRWERLFRLFCIATGLNLIFQALFTYMFAVNGLSIPIVFGGGLLASTVFELIDGFIEKGPDPFRGTLFLGFDAADYRMAARLEDSEPMLGVIGEAGTAPGGLPYLGGYEQASAIIRRLRPRRIVVGREWTTARPAADLLQWCGARTELADTASLCELTQARIHSRTFESLAFLFSPALAFNPYAVILQAVYTNLIGLVLLICLSPVLLLTAIAVAVFGGPGPILEKHLCGGFHYIPFFLYRFRAHQADRPATLTGIGSVISRLHLIALPQLVNVVRGEMALFGPHPVRWEFAQRLNRLVPFYSYRFSVKPGILDWSQVTAEPPDPRDVSSRMEFDLYYIKHISPRLDLSIFLSAIGRAFRRPAHDRAP